jgi:hypothetical protein
LAEIAARKQRRTLSGYIEWAVERSLDKVILKEGDSFGGAVSVSDAQTTHELWDVDEAERLLRLAFNFPELLTYEEQLIWRVIRDCGYIWRGRFAKPHDEWEWNIAEENLNWGRLREYWDIFKGVAAGEIPRERLPSWQKKISRPVPDPDDIPF